MLYEAFRSVASGRPEKCAVVTTSGERLTYGELADLVDTVAAGLLRRGVGVGSVVGCRLPNSAGYIALILAAASLGAAYVPIGRDISASEASYATDTAHPTFFVVHAGDPLPPDSLAHVSLEELAAGPNPGPHGGGPHDGPFRMLWTSGSTGLPKLVLWRQDKFVAERRRWLADVGITDEDVFFCRHTLDVAHATDLHVFAALLSGARLVLGSPDDSAATVLDQLAEHRVTALSALPRHYEQLIAAADERGGVSLPSLRRALCGGAYLSPTVVIDADRALGIRIRQIYGSTEFGLALGNMADVVQSDLGMASVRGVQARLEPLSAESADVGELVLRSPWTSEGYLNNDAANGYAFRDGEFWTGDVAIRLHDGSFRILGRVSETLAASAEPLSAPLLDYEILSSCPVTEVVCLAAHPGEYRDEVIVAVCPEAGVDEETVRDLVSRTMAQHRLKATVHVVEEIPHTAVGKADKPRVRRHLTTLMTEV